MELLFEQAKNGLETCKIAFPDNTTKYIYSKYSPERVKIEPILPSTKKLLLVGGGLGYEYALYRTKFDGEIAVLELSHVFQDRLKAAYPTMQFIDLVDLARLAAEPGVQVIEHKHILQLYLPQYLKLQSPKINKSIAVLTHPSIQKDCSRAFRHLGYEPVDIQWDSEYSLKESIASINPLFIFTINFNPTIARIAQQLELPYASWTVDTPAYNLYNLASFNPFTYCFVYDEVVVNRLRQAGLTQVYYLPVAAPVERYDRIQLSATEQQSYTCDISFLGSRCANNEWLQVFQHLVDTTTRTGIQSIVEKQCFTAAPIIEAAVTEQLIEQFEQQTGYSLWKKDEPLLTKQQRLLYFIGRYHSFVERTALLKSLQPLGDVRIYGEDSWASDFPPAIFKGHIENDVAMPKVFKASRINMNNIRSFVESGLPQRVFDILGCQGFLVSNDKSDLRRYFKDGHDLVIYRDEQDLHEIITHYLQHPEERQLIAHNGYMTVKQHHTFEQRLTQLIAQMNAAIR